MRIPDGGQDHGFVDFVDEVWPRLFRRAVDLTHNLYAAESLVSSTCDRLAQDWGQIRASHRPEADVHRLLTEQATARLEGMVAPARRPAA